MSEHIELAIKALRMAKGDDYARARRMFAGMDDAAMNAEYGESGTSCAKNLAGYAAHDAKYDAAVAWMQAHDKYTEIILWALTFMKGCGADSEAEDAKLDAAIAWLNTRA